MTPKEKAFKLIQEFRDVQWIEEDKKIIKVKWLQGDELKQCTLIAVEMILDTLDKNLDSSQFAVMNYWNDIKEEIENI